MRNKPKSEIGLEKEQLTDNEISGRLGQDHLPVDSIFPMFAFSIPFHILPKGFNELQLLVFHLSSMFEPLLALSSSFFILMLSYAQFLIPVRPALERLQGYSLFHSQPLAGLYFTLQLLLTAQLPFIGPFGYHWSSRNRSLAIDGNKKMDQ